MEAPAMAMATTPIITQSHQAIPASGAGVETVKVPNVIHRSFSSAKRIIENNGFRVGNVRYEVSTEYNVGIVIRQNPSAGREAKKGTAIDVVVATVLE